MFASAPSRWLACGSWHHFVQVWDLDQRELVGEWVATPGDKDGKDQGVNALVFCAGGSRLVTSGKVLRTFSVWESPSGRCVAQLDHPQIVNLLASYPEDGLFLAHDMGLNIDLWDVGSAKIVARAQTEPIKVPTVNVSTGERGMEEILSPPGATSLAVSPDGRLIAAGAYGGSVYLYEVVRGS